MASLQILTPLPQLSSPAKPSDNATLCANVAALSNLSIAQLKAIGAVCLIVEINAGQVGYTSNAQVINDAAAVLGGISLVTSADSRNAALLETAILWNNAWVQNNGISTDVAALLNTGRDFAVLPVETLTRIHLLLRYKVAL